jgi:hypothetical protein
MFKEWNAAGRIAMTPKALDNSKVIHVFFFEASNNMLPVGLLSAKTHAKCALPMCETCDFIPKL